MSDSTPKVDASTGGPKVTVLGAGPAGVAAAYALTKNRSSQVTVLERGHQVGGNSSSFQMDDIWVDYGSHRFHPVADPNVLNDVKEILGDDLLLRPRHGRIRLGGSWIHFPLKPIDAMLKLPKSLVLVKTLSFCAREIRFFMALSCTSSPVFLTVLRRKSSPGSRL